LKELTIHPFHEAADALDHDLTDQVAPLSQLSSNRRLSRSPLYQEIRVEVEKVLNSVAYEEFGTSGHRSHLTRQTSISAMAWNIERGLKLNGIIDVLRSHPVLSDSDVLLLTELDYGMARTGNLFVAREIAHALGINYAFAPCYLNLNKGSGLEANAEGDNRQALHGNAILSPHPMRRVHSIPLPNGKDKMRGREKRLGSQRAVIADVIHPLGEFRAVSLHLDAHSTQRHRHLQMRLVLDHLDKLDPQLPVLIGGDWNTTTYNSKRATYAIAGFFRRILMGVDNILNNHYPQPYLRFERRLFEELERRNYNFRELNESGVGTLHYDVSDLSANTNMADWVPRWCFWFMEKALERHNGRASLKLDWFAAKNIKVDPGSPPRVVGNLNDEQGPLSDHDAIVLKFIVGTKASGSAASKLNRSTGDLHSVLLDQHARP
jgi:endonuclease/exonuclease/phosphatase family metal-dependent hydrolase